MVRDAVKNSICNQPEPSVPSTISSETTPSAWYSAMPGGTPPPAAGMDDTVDEPAYIIKQLLVASDKRTLSPRARCSYSRPLSGQKQKLRLSITSRYCAVSGPPSKKCSAAGTASDVRLAISQHIACCQVPGHIKPLTRMLGPCSQKLCEARLGE